MRLVKHIFFTCTLLIALLPHANEASWTSWFCHEGYFSSLPSMQTIQEKFKENKTLCTIAAFLGISAVCAATYKKWGAKPAAETTTNPESQQEYDESEKTAFNLMLNMAKELMVDINSGTINGRNANTQPCCFNYRVGKKHGLFRLTLNKHYGRIVQKKEASDSMLDSDKKYIFESDDKSALEKRYLGWNLICKNENREIQTLKTVKVILFQKPADIFKNNGKWKIFIQLPDKEEGNYKDNGVVIAEIKEKMSSLADIFITARLDPLEKSIVYRR